MAGETKLIKEYWEQASCGTTVTTLPKHSRAYFEEIEEYRYRHEPFIHSFAQFTRWHGKRVLEVGFGAGTDFMQFIRAGASAYGVDLTQEAVDNVRHRLKVYGLSAEYVQQCNAELLPFDSDMFDLVYSWGVIHHAEHMEDVLSQIYRVARPGGTIKLMVYNLRTAYAWYMYVRHALLKGRITKGRRWAIYHYGGESFGTKVYTSKEIRSLLQQYPHADLRFHYWEQLAPEGTQFARVRRLLYHLLPRWTRWYLAFEFRKSSLGVGPS